MGKFKDWITGNGGGILSSLIGGTIGAITTGVENKKDRNWNAEQAELNRDYQTSEREASQAYNTSEREAVQAYNTSEREAVQDYNTSEREAAQAFNSAEAAKNRDWQTAEREATQDWNLEQWNRENEYNSPEAQMERMMAAGINPNVAIGQITGASPGTVRSSVGSGSSASVSGASSSGASSSPGSSSGMSGSVAGSGVRPGVIGGIITDSVNSMWQNMMIQKQIEGQGLDNELKGKELGVFDEQFQLSKSEINARIAEMNKSVEDKDADIKLKAQQFKFLEDMNPVQLQTAKIMYTRVESEVRHLDQQIENLKKQYELTDAQISNVNASTELIGAQEDLTESDKALRDLQVLYQQKENIVKDLESTAAEQGISFSAPDFWNLYNYQQKTGNNPANTLMKPTMKVERKRAWRQTGHHLLQSTGDALVNARASWISNPIGMYNSKRMSKEEAARLHWDKQKYFDSKKYRDTPGDPFSQSLPWIMNR